MRLVIQRVTSASVTINNSLHSSINAGLLIFAGIEEEDSLSDVEWLKTKICGLRIFSDENGKMNLNIEEVNGEILLVSQFTLYASTKKGNRPSFIRAAAPDKAILLYELFIKELNATLKTPVKTGLFGADMRVSLINDGPVTLLMDSKNRE
ncbi:MAG: D-tyrosyl-tRNA(Tyr) deacylase [Bacteroidetes bacterium]|nr:D-tyrosyl-tRNA(Tyr) deacylase [Bacteroidota bacterium]